MADERTTRNAAVRRAARRAELLDAALRAIRRTGPATSMEAIGAEGGVTKPVLYKHFGDREGLAREVAAHYAADLEAALAAVKDRSDPHDLLMACVDAYLRHIERDPQVFRFIDSEFIARHPGSTSPVSGLITRIAEDMAVVIAAELERTGRDAGAAEAWAYGLIGLVHFSGAWWLERRSVSRDELASHLTDLLWHGLAEVWSATDLPQTAVQAMRQR